MNARSALPLLAASFLLPACARHSPRIYPLQHEDAAAAAEVVDSLARPGSGIRAAVAVERSNVLVVSASDRGHEAVVDLLLSLDVGVEDGGSRILVIYLEEHRAEELAPVLRGLWPEDTLAITADARANALVLRGPVEVQREVMGVVGKLDLPEASFAVPAEVEGEAVIEAP